MGDRSFTDDDLARDKEARAFAWDARTAPERFDPVQVNSYSTELFYKLVDWWNSRSYFLCCINPCLRCIGGQEVIDGTDAEIWKDQLANSKNGRCPDSMKGLWWLQYNHAPENLVTIFSDAEFTGTFNAEGTDGFGRWERSLKFNWTRENAVMGLVLSAVNNKDSASVEGFMNMKDGICTVKGGKGIGTQIIYRQNDDEWWKVHYKANPGEEGERDIDYMYKWVKVLDKDGNKTKYWNEYVEWSEAPLPHSNCGTSWFPFWACCFPGDKITRNMMHPNPKQAVQFRDYTNDN